MQSSMLFVIKILLLFLFQTVDRACSPIDWDEVREEGRRVPHLTPYYGETIGQSIEVIVGHTGPAYNEDGAVRVKKRSRKNKKNN